MWETASLSGQGKREYNEDCAGVCELPDRCLAVVADGLGGCGGGQIASKIAVDLVTEEFSAAGNPPQADWLSKAFDRANQAVLGQQSAACQMKSTCVSLCLEEGRASWAHVGDSRLYHFIDGKEFFCTTDHSVSQMAVFSGEITRDQIRFHEDRNRVLRAFGGSDEIKPDFGSRGLDSKAFHAFLLCSDGFWEYVLETEMEIELSRAANPLEWLAGMEERLKQKTIGVNNDNYTAVAVFYTEEPLE